MSTLTHAALPPGSMLAACQGPLPGPAPAGPDLAGTEVAMLEFQAAQVLADGSHTAWRGLREQALQLLARSRDLRAARWVCLAGLVLEGWPGLAEGLDLIATWVAALGDALHPTDEPAGEPGQDDDDPPGAARARALAQLSPRLDRAHPSAAELAMAAALRAAGASGGPGAAPACRRALEALQSIDAACLRLGHQRPPLAGMATQLRAVLAASPPTAAPPPPLASDAAVGGGADGGIPCAAGAPMTSGLDNRPCGAGGAWPPSLASRDDARRALQMIAAYLRHTEPGSPVPLFVDRAAQLLPLDFHALVHDLLPDALPQLQRLLGPAPRHPVPPPSPEAPR